MREDLDRMSEWFRENMSALLHENMMAEARASVALDQDPTVQTCTVDDEGNMVMSGGMSDEDLKKEAERRTEEERKEWDKRTK